MFQSVRLYAEVQGTCHGEEYIFTPIDQKENQHYTDAFLRYRFRLKK